MTSITGDQTPQSSLNVQNSLATEIQSTQPPQLPSNTLNHSLTIKLDEHNYLFGKSQILTFRRSCQGHHQTILNWIFSSLSEGIHALIINSATSFVAWDYQGSGNIEFNCNPQRKVPFP
ncbi:hypothetical protein AAG906_005595 [Vitis piasezkii]